MFVVRNSILSNCLNVSVVIVVLLSSLCVCRVRGPCCIMSMERKLLEMQQQTQTLYMLTRYALNGALVFPFLLLIVILKAADEAVLGLSKMIWVDVHCDEI